MKGCGSDRLCMASIATIVSNQILETFCWLGLLVTDSDTVNPAVKSSITPKNKNTWTIRVNNFEEEK